jgi:hypothetical protein
MCVLTDVSIALRGERDGHSQGSRRVDSEEKLEKRES